MTASIIYVHEEALRLSHPVFQHAPHHSRAIFVWDDHYFRELNYSLKRLVFIYETLCELPIDIIHGDTNLNLRAMQPKIIYTAYSNHPAIGLQIAKLHEIAEIKVIADEAFCEVEQLNDLQRFSRYWKQAQKSVFNINRK